MYIEINYLMSQLQSNKNQTNKNTEKQFKNLFGNENCFHFPLAWLFQAAYKKCILLVNKKRHLTKTHKKRMEQHELLKQKCFFFFLQPIDGGFEPEVVAIVVAVVKADEV